VRAVAYGLYQGRMKAAIHALKYGRLHPAAKRMGRMLAGTIAQLADEAPAEMLVVPVPLHRAKFADRGFNQARALAGYALRFLVKTHPEWRLTLASSTLMRLRATVSQAGLNPRERRLNVRGAFTVSDPGAVAEKHILLIDDILTTGATARSAARSLVRAGAASVWVATLARARKVNEIDGGEIYRGEFYRGADFQGTEDGSEFAGSAPDAEVGQASIDSSEPSLDHQRSF
jgi:ComF family protein